MWDALHASMRHWYRLIGAGSEGARVFERDGVVAALVPASPQRSVVNAVVYEHADALAAAYDEIAAAYDEIGAKWTVWVHNGDGETVTLLESKGHVLDGSPEAMAADFEATPPRRPPDGALSDWTAAGDLAAGSKAADVASGRGAYVLSGDWQDTDQGSPYLVDGKGRANPLLGDDAAERLGYAGYPVVVVPDTWIELLRCGVVLSPTAALSPPTEPDDDACA